MFKKVVVAGVLLLAGLAGFVATRPAEFTVERSSTIAAPPAVVFALVNDLHLWAGWSPWEKMDPAMKRAHSGAPAGPGAVYDWDGNSDVGQGRMTITEAVPPSRLGIKLEFLKPFEATNAVTFRFDPAGEGTRVTWTMAGTNNFMAKAMCLVMDMDKMVGGDFERGLANLKSTAESQAAQARTIAVPDAPPSPRP